MNQPSQARAVTNKHVILFLAANPSGTDRLALDREARSIHAELKRSGHRDRFDFVTRWAAEPLDLLRELRKLKPTVVHFSGHGTTCISGHAPGPVAHRDVGTDVDHHGDDPPLDCSSRGPMVARNSSRPRRSRRRSVRQGPRSS